MAKKQNSFRKTAARIVMDVFLKRQALTPDTAIPIEEFKDVKLTSSIISYTIGNFLEDDIVKKTGDDRYYFVEANWKKMEKKVGRAYWILLGLPLICLIVILLITHWGDFGAIFFK